MSTITNETLKVTIAYIAEKASEGPEGADLAAFESLALVGDWLHQVATTPPPDMSAEELGYQADLILDLVRGGVLRFPKGQGATAREQDAQDYLDRLCARARASQGVTP